MTQAVIRPFSRPPSPKYRTYLGSWPSTEKEVSLEIGCGNGEFAFAYSCLNPTKQVLGFERTSLKFKVAQQRLSQLPAQPSNLCLIQGNAENWLAHDFSLFSFSEVFFLYPNPYPKPSQKHHRWHNSSFMQFLKTRLTFNAKLTLRTNLLWYAEEAKEMYTSLWGFRCLSWKELSLEAMKNPNSCVLNPKSPALTAFERKYLARGESCFELRLALL